MLLPWLVCVKVIEPETQGWLVLPVGLPCDTVSVCKKKGRENGTCLRNWGLFN